MKSGAQSQTYLVACFQCLLLSRLKLSTVASVKNRVRTHQGPGPSLWLSQVRSRNPFPEGPPDLDPADPSPNQENAQVEVDHAKSCSRPGFQYRFPNTGLQYRFQYRVAVQVPVFFGSLRSISFQSLHISFRGSDLLEVININRVLFPLKCASGFSSRTKEERSNHGQER